MRRVWQVFRAVMSVLLLLVVLLPAGVYVLLSLEPVQNSVRDAAVKQLSGLLDAEIGIESVEIHPFRRLSVRGVSVSLDGDTVAGISTVSAGFELYPLLAKQRFVLNYALVDGLWLKVNRPTPGAPMNIQPILNKLKKGDSGEKKKFNLEISTVVVRRASARYDVLSEPLDTARFDANHIYVRDLAVNAFIPKIADDGFRVSIDHLSFVESSGFELVKLMTEVDIERDGYVMSKLDIRLPHSHLALAPLKLTVYNEDIKASLRKDSLLLQTEGDNYVYLPDFKAFVPMLGGIDRTFGIGLDASLSLADVNVRKLELNDTDGSLFRLTARGNVKNPDNLQELSYNLDDCHIIVDGVAATRIAGGRLKPAVSGSLSKLSLLALDAKASGTAERGNLNIKSMGSAGNISGTAEYRRRGAVTNVSADMKLAGVNLGLLTSNSKLGQLNARVSGNAVIGKKLKSCVVNCDIASVQFNGYKYKDAAVDFVMDDTGAANFELNLNDVAAQVRAIGSYEKDLLRGRMYLSAVDFHALGFDKDREDYVFGADIELSMSDLHLNSLVGSADIRNLYWLSPDNQGLRINKISLNAANDEPMPEISVTSPYITGSLRGQYDFRTIAGDLRSMAEHFMPAIVVPDKKPLRKKNVPADDFTPNKFRFDFKLSRCQDIAEFFNLPAAVLADGILEGVVDVGSGYANCELELPYIIKGDKIIENTDVFAMLDVASDKSLVYATTSFPTKKGDMSLAAHISAKNNTVHTNIDWGLARQIPLNGTMEFSATLNSIKTPEGSAFPVEARLDFLPGTINFGDETWRIEHSSVEMDAESVVVKDFALDTGKQRIDINGSVGKHPENVIDVRLSDIRLLPIFETLEINNVLIDGVANGSVSAGNLLGGIPLLRSPGLHVDSIGYNRCYFGSADVTALWDTNKNSVFLDANIDGFEGKKSHIYGDIFPMSESLDLNFVADSIPVGFLKPFMAAFTSDISGRASGRCRLFGTFKDLDLVGDVYADNVKLMVDFTNVSYTATDSVHMRPGLIQLENVTVYDPEGNTALLNGEVKHTYFSRPVFNFDITGARDLLSFNVTDKQNPDWYGRIYGTGSAKISGYPGVVNISADMTTGPRSTFTFVLSDRLDAEEYSFLDFRDVTPPSQRPPVTSVDDTPSYIKEMKKKIDEGGNDAASEYNMDIRVNATPAATMTLVMDPAGGDEIKANGDGSIHMAYHSANNDLNIWGKYRVQTGMYRFTLQDIIIRNFTIKEGSEIQFDGDPYAVKTSLSAFYATNANLSDLDKSFLQDKEVARTNVPVHALMNVSGDIRQPAIDFDLEFPTLAQDTYRKVKSIVSTSDMMNRQIMYLLALNRFYTPDYMASTTSGNELFSVASSTISSQLGNMLGKLSNKWSIAPNLRSDRGDFSDVEVDVALSSRLLNNRLIFNGNFGYRDKSLNSNQFIGDFDVEYLLDKSGIWRLKAYNRYNDRNYYARTAQTTQGLGIMFRRDFDSLTGFLRKKKTEPVDTTAVEVQPE